MADEEYLKEASRRSKTYRDGIDGWVRKHVGDAAAECHEGPEMWDIAAKKLGFRGWDEVRQSLGEFAVELRRRRQIWIDGGWTDGS